MAKPTTLHRSLLKMVTEFEQFLLEQEIVTTDRAFSIRYPFWLHVLIAWYLHVYAISHTNSVYSYHRRLALRARKLSGYFIACASGKSINPKQSLAMQERNTYFRLGRLVTYFWW